MSILIDDNEVSVPCSTPLPAEGGEPPTHGGDADAPARFAPAGIPPSSPAVVGRPAMELSPVRSVRAGDDDSRVLGATVASDWRLDVRPENSLNDIRVDPRSSRSDVQDVAAPIGTEMAAGNARLDDQLQSATFHRASTIAAHLGISPKSVHRLAKKEKWPAQGQANRREYQPPFEVPFAPALPPSLTPAEAPVTFTGLALESPARRTALRREEAVLFYQQQIAGCGVESALTITVKHFAALEDHFFFHRQTLRAWRDAYAVLGLNGLIDQKQGRVGRKSYASKMTADEVARAKAANYDHGSVARGYRVFQRDPGLSYQLRETLHDGHASKSHVAASLRAAAKISPTTRNLLQGAGKARLEGRFTPCTYGDVKAGQYFCGDDMTSNVVAWREHPNALGYILGQPQILPVIDVGSLRWLNVRVIMNAILKDNGQTRSRSSYTQDDVWGLYGDVFDTFGLPEAFVTEFGAWQGKTVIGEKSGISSEERVGGLASLGVRIVKSFDPRTKIIETCFNQLQHHMDAIPGWAGRDQRKQLPETIKRLLAECRSGKRHPRTVFPHVSQLADAVETAMENFNQERGDGEILRGRTPLEKWAEDAPTLSQITPEARWMYRSARSKSTIGRNGVKVSIGSGKKLLTFYYDNPAVFEEHAGQPVRVFWNDHNPEADAVVLCDSLTSPGRFTFLCTAAHVGKLPRFGGSDEQLAAERQRKGAAMDFARTEVRAIQPHMQRKAVMVPADDSAKEIGENLATAAREGVEKQQQEVVRAKANKSAARFGALASRNLTSPVPPPETIEIL